MENIEKIRKLIYQNDKQSKEVQTKIDNQVRKIDVLLSLTIITTALGVIVELPNIYCHYLDGVLSYIVPLIFNGTLISIFIKIVKEQQKLKKLDSEKNDLKKENDRLNTKLLVISDRENTKLYEEYMEVQKTYEIPKIERDYSIDSSITIEEILENIPFEMFGPSEHENTNKTKTLKKHK